ncbi:MAG: hypothetical protein GX085_06135 [Firmicutes bacterium]|nr:hypothetical protein [Bacillota bacterium]
MVMGKMVSRFFNGRLLTAVAAATYKEWAAYRSHILVSLFVGPVYFLVQYFIWSALFQNTTTLKGFTLQDMLVYYGVTTLINYCIMDFADWNLQMLIRTGRFITFLLRPVSHRFFALSQKVGHRFLGFWLEFVPVYLIFFFVFRLPLVPADLFWSLLSLVLGFLMMFLVNYSIGITGFWLIRTDGLRSFFLIFRDVFAGVFVPLVFFPGWLQKALFFLPFQYISYVPVRVFSGSYELGGITLAIPVIVAIQAVYVVFMGLVSEFLWRLGIKRFTGVGV